jgi:hypothetical protein
MQKYFILVILVITVFSACVKDRNLVAISTDTPISYDTTKAYIVANEIVATGSTYHNELGTPSDWIELYNPSNHVMDFTHDNIYITDTIGIKDKFKLTQLQIQPHQFLVICCDDSSKVLTQIHTSFHLSKTGEFVGVYRKNSNGTFTAFTEHPFGAQSSGFSEGQKPDASNSWSKLTPTPGASNN